MHKCIVPMTLVLTVPISAAIIVRHQNPNAPPTLVQTEPAIITTQDHLLGKTQSIDLVAITESAITASRQLITAKVSRQYTHFERIERSILGLTSDAVITLQYTAEYAIGYDLANGRFEVSDEHASPDAPSSQGTSTNQDSRTNPGTATINAVPVITITLPPPHLVAQPGVRIDSHEVLNAGFLIDEKSAVIDLQQKLHRLALDRANAIAKDPGVVSLCEQQLLAFLRDILQNHPDVKRVPEFRINHRKT